jgi:hypothetical protein
LSEVKRGVGKARKLISTSMNFEKNPLNQSLVTKIYSSKKLTASHKDMKIPSRVRLAKGSISDTIPNCAYRSLV